MPLVTVTPFSNSKTQKAIDRAGKRMVRKLAEHQADLLRQDSPIGDRDKRFMSPEDFARPHIADTIKVEQFSEFGGGTKIAGVTAADYWPFALEFDTKPHTIRVKNAKALRFKGADGKATFRQSVEHPGTKGPKLVSKTQKITADAAQEIVGTELRIFVNEAVR